MVTKRRSKLSKQKKYQNEKFLPASSLGKLGNPIPHFSPETFPVTSVMVCSLNIERVFKVGKIREEAGEAPDHVLDPPGGGPAQPIHTVRSE
jgi:hypothetical protein